MRAKASQFVLLLVSVLATAYADASPMKSAHKPLPARRSEARTIASASRKSAPLMAKSKPAKPSPTPVASRTRSHQKPGAVQAAIKRGKPVSTRGKPVSTRGKPTSSARREPAPELVQPSPSEDIHVTHDRKRHYSAAPVEPPALVAAPKLRDLVPKEALPKPPIMAALYDRRGRLVVPPALKGSHEILLHQNEMADRDGLDRVKDDDALDDMRDSRLLVPIPSIAGIQTDGRLPANRRYCRPWTAQFLTALARAHYARFHTALQVNSAVRTVEFQQHLLLTNGNAAPAEGDTASPHLTGQAIDLAKHGLSLTEIAWLRGYLLPLVQAGKVDVEEEFQQACFHISVYRKYMPQPAPNRDIAKSHRATGASLAAAIR